MVYWPQVTLAFFPARECRHALQLHGHRRAEEMAKSAGSEPDVRALFGRIGGAARRMPPGVG